MNASSDLIRGEIPGANAIDREYLRQASKVLCNSIQNNHFKYETGENEYDPALYKLLE